MLTYSAYIHSNTNGNPTQFVDTQTKIEVHFLLPHTWYQHSTSGHLQITDQTFEGG